MVLKNTGQVDGIFFEVIEGADCIEKGSIVSLGAQCYGLIVGVDVALPNVVEDVVGFNRIAWYENPEKGIVNSFRGQANHQRLQFPVDGLAIRPTRRKVETWRKKIIGPILMSLMEDVPPDLVDGQGAQVVDAEESRDTADVPGSIGNVASALRELNIILATKEWGGPGAGSSNCKISVVQFQLDSDELDPC